MRRLLAHGLVLVLCVLGVRAPAADDRQEEAREALKALQDFIGGWKGSGAPEKPRPTSDEIWSERLTGHFSASPLYAGGRLYFFSEDGPAYVAKADKTWQLLATNTLEDGLMASPAVAGNALILRTKTHLYRIEKTPTSAAQPGK